jgi:hypothetical protein
VAQSYFDDGTISLACPPLKALLEIMANGKTSDGHDFDTPEFRALFTREYLLASDWYAARLKAKQAGDIALWERHVRTLEEFCTKPANADVVTRLGFSERLTAADAEAARVSKKDYLTSLVGTIGVQPL